MKTFLLEMFSLFFSFFVSSCAASPMMLTNEPVQNSQLADAGAHFPAVPGTGTRTVIPGKRGEKKQKNTDS